MDTATNTHSRTDEELLCAYNETGEHSLFEVLVERYERELYNYLYRYLGNADAADDVFQLTFLQIHLRAATFDGKRRFRPWAYAVATNAAIDFQRRNKRHLLSSLDRRSVDDDALNPWLEKLVADTPCPLSEATNRENAEWVHAAVAELSDTMRETVELVFYQGLRYREAAEVLGVPVGTIKSRMHVVFQRLAQAWQDSHSTASESPF